MRWSSLDVQDTTVKFGVLSAKPACHSGDLQDRQSFCSTARLSFRPQWLLLESIDLPQPISQQEVLIQVMEVCIWKQYRHAT